MAAAEVPFSIVVTPVTAMLVKLSTASIIKLKVCMALWQ